jgi:hypothetical protein
VSLIAKILTLIDKQDSCEKVRDQIAAILAVEVAKQRALATTAGKDPNLYSFSVYIERSKPWVSGEMPLVNILFDSDRFDNKGATLIDKQPVVGTFYIDCYAKKDTSSSTSGDELASKEADRIARLARNIIMAGEYGYLAMGARELGVGKNIVSKRVILTREKFQPDIRNEAYENIVACRLKLEVTYEEYSPQYTPVDFELLITSCKRASDGKVLFTKEDDMEEEGT